MRNIVVQDAGILVGIAGWILSAVLTSKGMWLARVEGYSEIRPRLEAGAKSYGVFGGAFGMFSAFALVPGAESAEIGRSISAYAIALGLVGLMIGCWVRRQPEADGPLQRDLVRLRSLARVGVLSASLLFVASRLVAIGI